MSVITRKQRAAATATATDWNLANLARGVAHMERAWRIADYTDQYAAFERDVKPSLENLRALGQDADAIWGALVVATALTRPSVDERDRLDPVACVELVQEYRQHPAVKEEWCAA